VVVHPSPPVPGGAAQVMISYRKNDCGGTSDGGDGTALRLKNELERLGWSVFLDSDGLEGGAKWCGEDVRPLEGRAATKGPVG
jgi:hypothetical protein